MTFSPASGYAKLTWSNSTVPLTFASGRTGFSGGAGSESFCECVEGVY